MSQDERRVVIGMDPHKRSLTIEVMADDETVVGGDRFATDVDARLRQPLGRLTLDGGFVAERIRHGLLAIEFGVRGPLRSRLAELFSDDRPEEDVEPLVLDGLGAGPPGGQGIGRLSFRKPEVIPRLQDHPQSPRLVALLEGLVDDVGGCVRSHQPALTSFLQRLAEAQRAQVDRGVGDRVAGEVGVQTCRRGADGARVRGLRQQALLETPPHGVGDLNALVGQDPHAKVIPN